MQFWLQLLSYGQVKEIPLPECLLIAILCMRLWWCMMT